MARFTVYRQLSYRFTSEQFTEAIAQLRASKAEGVHTLPCGIELHITSQFEAADAGDLDVPTIYQQLLDAVKAPGLSDGIEPPHSPGYPDLTAREQHAFDMLSVITHPAAIDLDDVRVLLDKLRRRVKRLAPSEPPRAYRLVDPLDELAPGCYLIQPGSSELVPKLGLTFNQARAEIFGGGLIEPVRDHIRASVLYLVDEEGRLKDLPPNLWACRLALRNLLGPVVVVIGDDEIRRVLGISDTDTDTDTDADSDGDGEHADA